MREQQILEMRLTSIDRRFAEIDARLPTCGNDSYVHQELSTERQNLVLNRNVADLRLREIKGEVQVDPDRAKRMTEDEQRRAKLIKRQIEERRETGEAFVAKLEAQGEFQQARIHRLALLDIPAQVAREFGQ